MEKIPRLTTEQRSNLVAYLDGELDETANQEIENVLSKSPVARHEVELLMRTWDLLDVLPQPTASAEFTARTLSSLHVAEVSGRWTVQPWLQRARKGMIVAGGAAGLAAAAALGFLATNRWVPNRSQQLVEELPVIEELDTYADVQDVEFLRLLQRSGLFDERQTEEEP